MENMDRFFKVLAANPEYQAKVISFGDDIEALAAFAREQGYDVSTGELREYYYKARELLKAKAQKKLDKPDFFISPGAQDFYALIKLGETDESVGQRLAELVADTPEALIAYGKERGFTFSEQDIQAAGDYILEP